MCGICGWYRRDRVPVERAVIEAQCATLVHRGPDDQGVLADGDFGFGMRRLSIIDLAGGHQPMTSDDGRLSIVYNGEIFNFPELRRTLESEGHRFRTSCDTEVILRGYQSWGGDVWRRLEGMFAVAIWDHASRMLALARDPLGIKPLFYTVQQGGIAFASELKGLTPVPGLRFTPRAESVDAFFAFGHVLAPHTIYEEVQKLEPGTVLMIGPEGASQTDRFWRFTYRRETETTEREWIERFRDVFTATVRRHLIADVPLGAFLSGGVDSSAVVAAMTRVSEAPVRTFTIGFTDPRIDESAVARQVAAHLGCRHTERQVQIEDASRILPELARSYDEPFADPSAIPTWYVSRLAREQVTVALSGDGGDELFAGYERHLNERWVQRLGPLRGALGAVRALPPLPNARWNTLRQRLRKIASDAALPSTFERFFSKYQLAPRPVRVGLYHRDFAARLSRDGELARLAAAYFPEPVSADPLENLLYADTVVRLPDDMLTKVDRASMAHSLEVRVPFLSHVFVDWSASVPAGLKLRGTTGKYLVRRAIEPWLPPGVLDRPKQGFAVPLGAWVRDDLGRYAESLWRDSGADRAGFLAPEAVAARFAEHRSGRADRSQLLYALAMFALWWAQRPGAVAPASGAMGRR
ncbi:MAG TPA: asparagine synthase (glutamine-hydrolyzing) [Candidatus Limnocylindria bacterium]|nr:asparagine synthase (glutamine-hydrolyzing) [Candidatus Limnocylindria bacterium]